MNILWFIVYLIISSTLFVVIYWYSWKSKVIHTDIAKVVLRGKLSLEEDIDTTELQVDQQSKISISLEIDKEIWSIELQGTQFRIDYLPKRGRELKAGDRVEIEGALVDEKRVEGQYLIRRGWPRFGYLIAFLVASALVAGVFYLNFYTQKALCPNGTQAFQQITPTTVSHFCRKGQTNHGPSAITNRLGQVVTRGWYKDGLKEGRWHRYYKSGHPSEIITYHKGYRIGWWRRYYHNGSLKSQCKYEKKRCAYLELFNDGERKTSGFYIGEKRSGHWIDYHRQGYPKTMGKYCSDEKCELWRGFYQSGEKKWETAYKKDKREGIFRRWTKEGNLFVEGYHLDDQKTALWRWRKNKKIQVEGSYLKGKKDGLWKYYNEKEKLKGEGYFKEGLRIGKWKWYCDHCLDCEECKNKTPKNSIVTKDYSKPTRPNL